jgi:hypothetical protein
LNRILFYQILFNTAKIALTNVSSPNPAKLDAIRTKMEDRVVRLSLAISRDLSNPDVKKSHVQKCVRWLLRLGYGEQVINLNQFTIHISIKLLIFKM